MIVFFENAFKYAKDTAHNAIYIEGEILLTQQHQLHFSLQNTFSPHWDSLLNRPKGTGLDNVQRRLEMLYPNQYKLQISKQPTRFVVQLNLTLKPMQHD